MKKRFVLYLDQKEIFEALTYEDAGRLIRAIFEFEETGVLPDLDGVLKFAFIPIKTALDANREKHEALCAKRKQAGAKECR